MIQDKYKTFWRRFWAFWLDTLILAPVYMAVQILTDSEGTSILIVADLLYISIYPLYTIVLHGRYGQTIGKRAFKIKILDVLENKLSFKQAIYRDIVPLLLILMNIFVMINLIQDGSYQEMYANLRKEKKDFEKYNLITEKDLSRMTDEELDKMMEVYDSYMENFEENTTAKEIPQLIFLKYGGLVWFLLEFITMLFNRKRRALHDFLARSVVVRV